MRRSGSCASAASGATSTSCRCCSASGPNARDELVRDGHRLRVYVPFGRYWYEYSLRRLQENPAIARYVAADLFRRRGRLDTARGSW